MTVRENCIYCGKAITKRSKEHIVQNALGGLIESEDICCEECNNYISKYIDAPFTKIFNPIISMIDKFAKTNNTNSHPICTGKAIYENEIYNVRIKNGKVVGCPELSKKLKCDASKISFKILSYDFLIESVTFKRGIGKIAFNFALEKGIDFEKLSKGVEISRKDGKVENIIFKFPVLPFVALNPMDKYIELETTMELYHNLILFIRMINCGAMLICLIHFNATSFYQINGIKKSLCLKRICKCFKKLIEQFQICISENQNIFLHM